MRRRFACLLLLAAPVLAEEFDLAAARARVRELEKEIEALIARVAPAVGAITNYGTLFDEKTGKVSVRPRSLGSGLVVTADVKTPTLREVGRTAPYMHDGSLETLEEVIEFYNNGGRPNPSLDPAIHPLNLTEEEEHALLVFLESLSGRVLEGSIR